MTMNREELEKAVTKKGQSVYVKTKQGPKLVTTSADLTEDAKGESIADDRGFITHEGATAIIKAGGSVLYRGQAITDVDDLPTADEMAKWADEQEAASAAREARNPRPAVASHRAEHVKKDK